MTTNKQKFNKKYGFSPDAGHSLAEIARKSGISRSTLQEVYNRGVGARKNNPQSVRSQSNPKVKPGGKSLKGKMSAEQWGMGRVYGFVMNNPKQVAAGAPDSDLKKGKKKVKK
tara:strand:+ start:45 stop:383 length:339 start_codon:yes stop_codon:yes gene_type:complete